MIHCPTCGHTRPSTSTSYPLQEADGRRRRYECACLKVFHSVEVHEAEWRRLLAANARLQILESKHARK